jgi:CheY-specific phosphatase CheX
MEALQTEISAKDFDLYTQAEKFIKPKTQDDNVKVAKSIVSSMKKTTKISNLKEKVEESLKEINNKSLASKNEQLSKKRKQLTPTKILLKSKMRNTNSK